MRKKLFVLLLLLTLVSTSAFADGVMGSGGRSDSGQIIGSGSSTEGAPQFGNGAAVGPFMGSGGLAQRVLFTLARAFAGGLLGSGN